jgi:uncharacterized protein YdeI (YjbR/CyaY-like superfamily)
MNPKVDLYLADGCGRCSLYRTPECKVHDWEAELRALRAIVLECGLTEDLKWAQPCYTFEGGNIAMVSAFKEHAFISFFKGSLLKDEKGILTKPGENTQSGRVVRFTDAREIAKLKDVLKAYIFETVELEKAGLKVETKKNPEPIPDELQAKLDENPAFQAAFFSLTPGRQRGYILYFSQPKQSKTRTERIEKYVPQIMIGKGFHDDYAMKKK